MSNWARPRMTVYMPLTYMVWGGIAYVAQRPPDAQHIALNPAYFHALNVLFHLLAVFWAMMLLRRLIGHDVAALLGAAIFAVHPLQAEALAWASDGMYTALSGALSLWALYHYLRFAADDQT